MFWLHVCCCRALKQELFTHCISCVSLFCFLRWPAPWVSCPFWQPATHVNVALYDFDTPPVNRLVGYRTFFIEYWNPQSSCSNGLPLDVPSFMIMNCRQKYNNHSVARQWYTVIMATQHVNGKWQFWGCQNSMDAFELEYNFVHVRAFTSILSIRRRPIHAS